MSIFKYVTEERIGILKESCIRFTQPSQFNDPFEISPYFKAITDDKYVEELIKSGWNEAEVEKLWEKTYIKMTEENPIVKYIPKEKLKELTLQHIHTSEVKNIYESLLNQFFKLNNPILRLRQRFLSSIRKSLDGIVGILCLTEKPDNLLMWAHYSNGHRGFVIEFDETHSYFDRRTKPNEIRKHLKKVSYSKQRPEILAYDSRMSESENLDTWINKFFWNKGDSWEYEQEWRMIDALNDCQKKIRKGDEDIYLFSLPIDCIKGIILGCNMLEEDKYGFINLLQSDKKYSHINIKQAVIDEKDFRINII